MNLFGRLFRLSIFGRSHGVALGIVVDGVPVGIPLKDEDFLPDLKRRGGGVFGTTQRVESDSPKIISGIYNGFTSGDPICLIFENQNVKRKDYNFYFPRPSHADFVADKKYFGFSDKSGGGHFSGRLTLGIVAAGVIAKKILGKISIKSKILEVGGSKDISNKIEKAKKYGDSVGGLVQITCKNVPIGLGEPFFYNTESVISSLLFSIPAVKGVEFGAGFRVAKRFGSQNNDLILNKKGKTKTNNEGGINGGITNGNELLVRVAVKPTASISKSQKSYNYVLDKVADCKIEGRHDTCITLRAQIVLEAAVSIALSDLYLMNKLVK